jgi:hypothetical protein
LQTQCHQIFIQGEQVDVRQKSSIHNDPLHGKPYQILNSKTNTTTASPATLADFYITISIWYFQDAYGDHKIYDWLLPKRTEES